MTEPLVQSPAQPPTEPLRDVEAGGPAARRATWLRVLAQAPASALAARAAPVCADHRFEWLRRPEQGLVMLRARIGHTGDRFNLGEATVTRCTVRHTAADGRAYAGVGHVLGRDADHAGDVARLDALLQVPAMHTLLWTSVVLPLEDLLSARRQQAQARTAESRVHFYTLQPEATA